MNLVQHAFPSTNANGVSQHWVTRDFESNPLGLHGTDAGLPYDLHAFDRFLMSTPLSAIYQFCPRCGVDNSETLGANPFRCHSCDLILHFGPVTAVGGIVTNDANEILFLVRARDPGKNQLGIPGGFVDQGESAEIALAREVREEVNLTVTESQFLCSRPNDYLYRGVMIPVTDIFFVCHVESFEPLKHDPNEVNSVHFLKPTQETLDKMAFPSNRAAVEEFMRRQA